MIGGEYRCEYHSVSILLANGLDFVQTMPVVRLGHLCDVHNQFVGLLHYLRVLDKDAALGFGDGKYPVFALVVMNFDF